MTRRERQRLARFHGIVTLQGTAIPLLEEWPVLKQSYELFISKVAELDQLLIAHTSSLKGYAIASRNAHEMLLQKASLVIDVGIVGAVHRGDRVVEKAMREYRFRISRMSRIELVASSHKVNQMVTSFGNDLISFGGSTALMDSFTAAINACDQTKDESAQKRKARKNERKQFNGLMKECTTLLRDHIDRAFRLIGETESALLAEYQGYRKYPKSKPKSEPPDTCEVYGTVTNGVTHEPIVGAIVRCEAQNVTETTDGDGYFVTELFPGDVTLRCIAAGYEDSKEVTLTLQDEDSTEQNFVLMPSTV